MTLTVNTPYVFQNVFTLNVLGQIPGGPGGSGFCAWAGLTNSLGSTIGWKLVETGANAYQITNAHFEGWVIAGHPNGSVFVYNGGAAPDQDWTFEAVDGQSSLYVVRNLSNGLCIYDGSACGVTGVPQAAAPVDKYNPGRFYWKIQNL